jgi:hypothetical protein
LVTGVDNPFGISKFCDGKVLNAPLANAGVAFWKGRVETSPKRGVVCNKYVAGDVFAVCVVARERRFVAVIRTV